MKNRSWRRFYVYVYLDPRKPGNYVYGEYSFDYEPFYVGKGSGERHLVCWIKHSNRQILLNAETCNKINEINVDGLIPIVKKIMINLSNINAYKLESKVIEAISKGKLSDSCLTNKNYGFIKKSKCGKN